MDTLVRHLSYKVQSISAELSFFQSFENPKVFHEFRNENKDLYGLMFKLTNGLDIELFTSSKAHNYDEVHFAFGVKEIEKVWSSLRSKYTSSDIFQGRTDQIKQFHVLSPAGFRFEFHEL